MEYRRATLHDMDKFLQTRMEFVASIRNIPDVETFEKNTKKYLTDNIESDKVIVLIAIEQGEIISSCMACLFELAPLTRCINGKYAELMNMYTKKGFRKCGHAKKLLGMLMAELKCLGVEKLLLEYTPEGLPVYEKMGFEPLPNQMQLFL